MFAYSFTKLSQKSFILQLNNICLLESVYTKSVNKLEWKRMCTAPQRKSPEFSLESKQAPINLTTYLHVRQEKNKQHNPSLVIYTEYIGK